jgi:hypothetical protein
MTDDGIWSDQLTSQGQGRVSLANMDTGRACSSTSSPSDIVVVIHGEFKVMM